MATIEEIYITVWACVLISAHKLKMSELKLSSLVLRQRSGESTNLAKLVDHYPLPSFAACHHDLRPALKSLWQPSLMPLTPILVIPHPALPFIVWLLVQLFFVDIYSKQRSINVLDLYVLLNPCLLIRTEHTLWLFHYSCNWASMYRCSVTAILVESQFMVCCYQ